MSRRMSENGDKGDEGWGRRDRSRLRPTVALALAVTAGLALSACSLHVSKNGVSGNVFGHSFSASQHQLPAGFPSSIPTPGDSQVLVGGGLSSAQGTGWDVAFAVNGTVAAGSNAYQAKFRDAGYSVTDVQLSDPTTVTVPQSSGSTSTTVTLTGSSFTATDATWKVQVLMGSSSSAVSSQLKPGQFGVNITAVPTPSTTTTTTG